MRAVPIASNSRGAGHNTTDWFISARYAFVTDSGLSAEARIAGLYLATKQPGWQPVDADIAARAGLSVHAARKAIRELTVAGYIRPGQRERINGQIRMTKPVFVGRDRIEHWQTKPLVAPEAGNQRPAAESRFSVPFIDRAKATEIDVTKPCWCGVAKGDPRHECASQFSDDPPF
jgi:hypothetical protein